MQLLLSKSFQLGSGGPWRRAGLGVALAALLVASLAVVGAAQAGSADEAARGSKRSRTLIVLRISEALDLDEQQTIRLATEYRRYDERRHELLAERAAAEAGLEAALARSPQDEAEIQRLTDELLATDREVLLLPGGLFETLQGMLDTEQRGRLALLKVRLQRKIDRERARRAAHQPGRTGDGPGGSPRP